MRRVLAAVGLALAALAPLALAQEKPPESEGVTRTRAQLGKLKEALAEIRGETLKMDVKVKAGSEEALDPDDSVDIDRRYNTRADQIARAYARIGLFPKGYELRQFMKSYATAVLAYYDPKKKTFFIVRSEFGETAGDSTAIHELNHALQDQRFDLRAYSHVGDDPDPIAMNDDAQLARRMVVEGEATYVGTIYSAKQSKIDETKVAEYLEGRATLSRTDFSRQERKYAQGEGGKSALNAANAYDSLPLYLYRLMLDPYVKGASVVSKVKKQGGWKAVDDLFTKPPASTKQLLHLEKLRAPLETVEIPDLAIVIGGGFKRTFENTFGEPGVACVLEARALSKKVPEVAAKIAETWTGDRFQAYETKSTETCAIWVTAWETDAAAKEFEAAGKEILKTEISGTRDSFVERQGNRVLLALAVPRGRARGILDAALPPKK
jgi:hypothetical protein